MTIFYLVHQQATMKPIIKYITLYHGRCGLTTDSAREVYAVEGRGNVASIRPATQKEVDWVRGMGGNVPDGRVVKAKA